MGNTAGGKTAGMERGITVHWDVQNDVSRHMAEKFGFEAEKEYSVYWLA